MPSKKELVGKTIMLKFSYLKDPCSAKVAAVETDGLWLENGSVMALLERAVTGGKKDPGAPPVASLHERFPLLFVPDGQIEWIAASRT